MPFQSRTMWLAAKIVIIAAVCSGLPINDVPCRVPEDLRGAYDLCADGRDRAADGSLPRSIVIGPDAITALAGDDAAAAVQGFRGELSCGGRERRVARDTVDAEDKERRPSDYREFSLRDTTHVAFAVALSVPASVNNVTVQEVTGHVCVHFLWRRPDSLSFWTVNVTRERPCEPDSGSEEYVADRYPVRKSDEPSSDGTAAVQPVTTLPPVTTLQPVTAVPPITAGPQVKAGHYEPLPLNELFDDPIMHR